MDQEYDRLRTMLGEVWDLAKVEWLLEWDQSTMMPPGGADVRAEQIATVRKLAHEHGTSDELGALLERLAPLEASLPRESDEASLIRVGRRDWTKARKVPVELATELARAGSLGFRAWIEARRTADFATFLPFLERMLELKKRYVACFPEAAEPYDALLDDFEPGMTAAEVRPVFSRVRDALVPLVRQVVERAAEVDDAPVRGHFPAEDQRRLSVAIIERWGFGPERWRLDPTHHPFASSIAPDDVRLTTRYDEAFLNTSLFGTLHECGHGLYEHGVSRTLTRTPLCRGASLALHESQSRMWENVVGRSRDFWHFAYPLAREIFPDHFARHDEEAVYRAVNKMGPSLIRVEADELTYALHIILRFEIEQGLIEGTIRPAELPEVWNTKMQEYLGVEVPNDAVGVLQDVHWSEGLLGYFPTYALGSMLASQIWERAAAELPGLAEGFARGEFTPLREWLVEHLHQHGRKFTAKETIALVTGGALDPEPYIRYLNTKVDALYA